MKIWENCNAFSWKDDEKKFLSHKIRCLISPISCCTSLAFCDTLLGWWMNGKFSFLDKVAFKVACIGVWCLYNRQNSTFCRYRITSLDISRESALNEGYMELITWREIALVQYNSQTSCNHKKNKTNKKTSEINFLKKNSNFDHETGH